MKLKATVYFWLLLATAAKSHQSYQVSFLHDGKIVYGTFTTPDGTKRFPTIIINPGSGANDRDGTFPMVGANINCLYPGLLNDTLRPYKELSDALVDSGFAVLRYDKLEYTYPTNLGSITFHKLWLPVESAINYVKTRTDVDTTKIVLIGHSEGSALIPFIAKGRNDVKALISLAGARTPFDSLLAFQIVKIAQICGGNVAQAQSQANQILSYFHAIRTNSWTSSTPPAFGVPASAWYDYFRATDSVAINYNLNNLPTLFAGMGLDFNVPPAELIRLQQEVSVTNDFWSMPSLIHYMTPSDNPHVSTALSDTIIHWLRQNNFLTNIIPVSNPAKAIHIFPNPFQETISLKMKHTIRNMTLSIFNPMGKVVLRKMENFVSENSILHYSLGNLPAGIYYLEMNSGNQKLWQKIWKD